MKPYRYCLFDVDGTLLDTIELIYRSFQHTCRHWGDFEIPREKVYANVGTPLHTQMKLYLGERPETEYAEILEFHREYQAQVFKDYLQLYPGVPEVLEELSAAGIGMGIVTSRTLPSLKRYLEYFDLLPRFSVIITPEDTQNHKPHPDPVLAALSRLNAPPADTLFVGDAVFDMQAGSSAGVDTAFAEWGPNDSDTLPMTPTHILKEFRDLTALFN